MCFTTFVFLLSPCSKQHAMDTLVSCIVPGMKIVVKTGLGFVPIPGLGAGVEFAEAGYALYNGDYFGCGMSLAFVALVLYTAGCSTVFKNAAKEGGKTAAEEVVKESAKSAEKSATKEVGKKLASLVAPLNLFQKRPRSNPSSSL